MRATRGADGRHQRHPESVGRDRFHRRRRRRSLPLHTDVKLRVHDEYLSEDIWISGTGPCEGYLSDLVTFRKFTVCAAKFTRIFTRLPARKKNV